MATIIEIADAVVALLNAGSYAQPVTAVRYYLPRFDLKEMATLHVSVVPKATSRKGLDRGRDAVDCVIDVGVQRKVDETVAALDRLMALVEQLADRLRTQPLAALPEARCVEVANEPVFAPEHLAEFRQFTSVLTATYRVWR